MPKALGFPVRLVDASAAAAGLKVVVNSRAVCHLGGLLERVVMVV